MPDITDLYPNLKDLDTPQLHARRNDLKLVQPMTDEALQELVCISRLLRVRGSITNAAKPKSTKMAPTIDML